MLAFEEANLQAQCQFKEVVMFPVPIGEVELVQIYCFSCSIDSENFLKTALPTKFMR